MVVTRFAPSPTGYLHIGGARTALFNWLYARHTGGRFLLRIEDTDLKRNTPAAVRQVMEDLKWLGIDWDEGPQVGGPNGPYFQSQRLQTYNTYVQKLVDAGRAYYCFDTAEDLAAMRGKATAQKGALIYRRPASVPDAAGAARAVAEGRPVTVRFAVEPGQTVVVNDVIRGEVRFSTDEISDFIIRKSDGFPTYNFACVVDDELMKITHVIRGQEHLMNTPGQQLLQKALGFGTPVYAHMSLTVSQSGGKLSKRERANALRDAMKKTGDIELNALAEVSKLTREQLDAFLKGDFTPDMPGIDAMAEHLGVSLPEINVVDFFRSGYIPETMVNFLALLGWNPGTGEEIMTAEQMIAGFDISRLTKSNSLFDRSKLLAFNTEHIRRLSSDKLREHFSSYLRVVESPLMAADNEMLASLLKINAGARTLAQIEEKCRFLFLANDRIEYDEKAVKKILLKPDAVSMMGTVRDRLLKLERLTEADVENMLRSLAKEKGVGLGRVAQPLRLAICGSDISPPIFDSVRLLGKENTLARIDIMLKKFAPENK